MSGRDRISEWLDQQGRGTGSVRAFEEESVWTVLEGCFGWKISGCVEMS